MRLQSLYIESFKNLHAFQVDFGPEPFTILVGQNGAGKSNLLEAITLIFRNLDLKEPPPFIYRLTYECRGNTICLNADPARTKREMVQIKVDGVEVKHLVPEAHLPGYVFGYYSGPSNRMEEHFEQHQKRFDKALREGEDEPMRRLFYARAVHSQFVLLAFYLRPDEEVQAFLRDRLRIEGLDSVLFVLQMPGWANNRAEGDPRFWGARGVVVGLLNTLYRLALAPLRLDVRVPLSYRQSTPREHLYLYLRDHEHVQALAANYSSPQELFKALESIDIADLLNGVRISVKVKGLDGTITFRELSEGEQQLLMVLGLLRFTREKESLFLLDEPDTHLNPQWSIEYIDLLNRIAGKDSTCQLLIATHNPMVVSALTKEEVRIMDRADADGQVDATEPEEDPKGMGIAGILTSDLYGLRSAVDIETVRALDRVRELTQQKREDGLSPEEERELVETREKVSDVDFTGSVRDPLYKPFVVALAEYDREMRLKRPAAEAVLSEEERRARRERALEVLRQLKAKAGESS